MTSELASPQSAVHPAAISKSAETSVMAGDGMYNRNCGPQAATIHHSIEHGFIRRALDAVTSHRSGPAILSSVSTLCRLATDSDTDESDARSTDSDNSPSMLSPLSLVSSVSAPGIHVLTSPTTIRSERSESPPSPSAISSRPLFVIGDYGCSQGANSIIMINAVLEQLGFNVHGGTADVDVMIYHTDLPTNDFSSLWSLLSADTDVNTAAKQISLVTQHPTRVYSATVGRSFFQRNVPNDHVDFAVASSAFQWLSAVPTPLSGSTWIHSYRHDDDAKTRLRWARAAAKDWKTILKNRAAELKSGGVLLLHNPARVEILKNINNNNNDNNNDLPLHIGDLMRDLVSEVFPLIGTGLTEFTLPLYRRTYAEHTDPATMRECGLTILFAEIVQVHNPINAEYKYSKNIQNFAHHYTHHVRAINQPALEYALKKYTMLDNVDEMISIYFEALEEKIIRMVEADDAIVDKLAKRQHTMFMAMKKN